MEQKINAIMLALFAISVLSMFSFVVMPANAQAIAIISGFNYGIKGISYQSSTDTFWVLSNNATASKVWLYQFDRETGSLIFSFNHTANWVANGFAAPIDLWCGNTDCFITTGSSTTGQIVKISTEDISPNIFKGKNITGSLVNPVAAGFYSIIGRDAVSGGFGSITLWVDTCSTSVASNCNGFVRIVDGISMLSVATLPLYSGTTNSHKLGMQWSGIAGATDNFLVAGSGTNADTAANNRVIIYNLATQLVECQTASPSLNSLLGVSANFDGGAGSANHKIYTGSINGILYVWSDACVLLQTITTGLSGDLRYVQYESGFLFVQETGSNAWIMQFATNSTGHVLTTTTNTYQTLPSTSQSAFISGTSIRLSDMVLLAGHGTLYFPYTGDTVGDKKIGVLGYGDPDGTETGGQSNGRCNVGTALDCVGDRSTLNQITGGTSWATLGNSLFGGIGLVNTTASTDVKENGTGLLLMLMLGSFFSSITIGSIAVANNKFGAGISYTEIPKEFWLFLVVGVISTAFYLQWIPDIIFYSMIVGIAGLFSFGLYKHIRGG